MIGKNNIKIVLLFCLMLLIGTSCHRASVPKPYGYVRLSMPDTAYTDYAGIEPFRFALSQNAKVQSKSASDGSLWVDIHYPALNITIHGTYYPIQQDLDLLTDEAIKFVYKHTAQATSIPEQAFVNEQNRVYGVFFHLQGNTASPYQFFLTDSAHHFFRASAYCECRPNADSLAPVYDYLEQDIRRLIESWQWVK